MKIIIPQIPTQIFYNTIQCLESIKHTANIEPLFWAYEHKSMLDMFDETQPDIVFLHESQLDGSFDIACQQFNFKYVLLTENPLPARLVKPPNAVITHPAFRHSIQENNVIALRPVASVAQIHDAQYQESMASDILIHTSGVEITTEIYKIISYLSTYYNVKIIGDGQVRLPQYLGAVNIFERSNFLKSTQLVIDINQYDFWDASYLKIPAICLHPTDSFMINFNDIPTLKNSMDSLLKNHLIRDKYIEMCYQKTIENNTYYHLCAELFQTIQEDNISQTLLQHIERLSA